MSHTSYFIIGILLIMFLFIVLKQSYSNVTGGVQVVSSTINSLRTPMVVLPTKTIIPTEVPDVVAPLTTQKISIGQLDLQYPSSERKATIDNKIILESYDNPFEITSWYQQKVKASDLKITSFIQTTTNGDVLNKIVGSGGNKEIRVEISKINKEPVTRITLSINF